MDAQAAVPCVGNYQSLITDSFHLILCINSPHEYPGSDVETAVAGFICSTGAIPYCLIYSQYQTVIKIGYRLREICNFDRCARTLSPTDPSDCKEDIHKSRCGILVLCIATNLDSVDSRGYDSKRDNAR